jgi:hypothetical protein
VLLQELASVVFSKGTNGSMAFFKLASDASGNEGMRFVTVSAWIALDSQWADLENVWTSFLIEHGVGHLHMRSFGTPDCKFGTGAWPANKQESFLLKLVHIAQSNTRHCWSMSAETKVYSRVKGISANQDMLGPTYSGCAQSLLARVEKWLTSHQLQFDKMAYIFEDGDRKAEIIHAHDEVKRELKMLIPVFPEEQRSISFLGKNCVPLQVADLLCHPINRLLESAFALNGTLLTKPGASISYLQAYRDLFDPLQSALLDHRRFSQECYVMHEGAWREILSHIDTAIRANPQIATRRRKAKANQGKGRRPRRVS